MPNGHDKNWIRLCAAINGFRARYGRWPTRVLMWPACLDDVESLFTPSDFTQITSKVALIADRDAPFVAEDEAGGTYNYGEEGFPKRLRKNRAAEWLGVTPKPESEPDFSFTTINGVPVEEYSREHGISLEPSAPRVYVSNPDRQSTLPETLRAESSQLIHLPDGDSAWVAKTGQSFPEWRGAPSADTFGRKKVLDYRGEPVFAELYVLRLLQAAGWNGVWVNSYGKKQYLTSYYPRESAVLPREPHALLTQIAERTQIIGSAAFPIGCWDVFAWLGDEFLFAECKRKKKDSFRTSQRMWLDAALALGISIDAFLIVEWTLLL